MDKLAESVLSKINADEVAQLCVELATRRSPEGYEKEVGDYIYDWLDNNGFDCAKHEAAPERNNIVGTIRGDKTGKTLIFNSHMDTECQFGDADYLIHRDTERSYYDAWIEGGRVYGVDVCNDKGPMACFLMAGKAILDSGVKLSGDLILTAVVGEMSFTAVDEFKGPKYLGAGCGTKSLVNHGVVGDFAVVAECTNFNPTWVECGDVRFKVTVLGQKNYTPLVQHPQNLAESTNSIVKATRVVGVIEEWAREFEQQHTYEFSIGEYGGVVVPKVNIGAIRGGAPYWSIVQPGVCVIYLGVYYPPNMQPIEVERELRDKLAKSGIEADVEMYAAEKGNEGKGVEPLLESIEKAHVSVFGCKPGKIESVITSMWRDVNPLNGAGIPAVTVGPPFLVAEQYGEGSGGGAYLTVDDVEKTTRLYALLALDICGARASE